MAASGAAHGVAMQKSWSFLSAGAAALALAACSTAPPPRPVAPVVVAKPKPLPYRWTQGNAPQAYQDMVQTFGQLRLKPGEFRWAADVPEAGETRVVIDLL